MLINPTNMILAVFFLWMLFLTYFIFKIKNHYRKLTSSTKRGTIDEILEKLLNDDRRFEKEIEKIEKELDKIELASNHYFQKLGIIRFNPFDRMGGEQSFVLALLNKGDSGVVINFIYTREGVRVYLKRVNNGKGVEYDLSQEEKEAIQKSR